MEPARGFWRVPLLEYGGLKPILPFFGGRSDAACRVVTPHSPFLLMPAWRKCWTEAYIATISPQCRL